ncbi:MAG: sulfurtransferase [Thermoplasmatota archaeon]
MAEHKEKEEGARVELVSTDWLSKRLKDEDMRIVDVQPNIHDYIAEHIPGAVYFNPSLLRVPFEGVPGNYIPEGAAGKLFERIGIKLQEPTVVYSGKGTFKGWGDGLEQTMIAYSLLRFGHENVLLLNGGLDKWKNESKPLTKEFPRTEVSRLVPKVRYENIVGYNELKNVKDNEKVMLLDARPKEVYEGRGPWIKPGHIPGAVNLPWKSLMDPENPTLLRPFSEIENILEEKGISRDFDLICSCGTGREATVEFLLFKYFLGFPKVRIYEGSFTEWTSHPDNPTVTGPDPE